MARSKIEWLARPGTLPESWNPVTGCTKVSEGCANCYAERMSKRLAGRFGYPEAPHQFDVTLHPDKLDLPMKWRKPRTVFVVSMGDLFHEDVLTQTIALTWRTMHHAPDHTFLVLTKRPSRMLRFLKTYDIKPLPNVWLGSTVENDKHYDRIHDLLQCPAAVRFVSIEPMLGPVDLSYWLDYDVSIGERPALDWIIVGGETGPGARPPWIVTGKRS